MTILSDGKIIFGFSEGTILVCTLDEINCELGKEAADSSDFVILVGAKQAVPILKGLKEDMFSTIITLVPDLEEHSEEFKICEQRANNSFEFDSICVLKCLNEFKNDYDYSCLSSCYY